MIKKMLKWIAIIIIAWLLLEFVVGFLIYGGDLKTMIREFFR